MRDPAFSRAYQRGVKANRKDPHMHWRVHTALWVASAASKLPRGDFVECGVNYGFVSSAIMEYLDWNSLERTFYLLDTFHGLDERFITDKEREAGVLKVSKGKLTSGMYVDGVELVRANFAQWKNVQIIQGSVPETLDSVKAEAIAYLHLDMNCAA